MPRGKRKNKNGAAAGAVKLARRHRESGEVSERKRGRPHPDFELGYLDADGAFQVGNPPKRRGRRRRGRGPGRPAGRPVGRPAGAVAARAGGLSEIEQIVRREVDRRVRDARAAAIAAISKALR